jgi:hypothetical protein
MCTVSTSKKSVPTDRYHHGDLRRALVDEALVLLAESGDGGFSLRELARRVGVTANASYRHFANKDALPKRWRRTRKSCWPGAAVTFASPTPIRRCSG